MNRKIPRTLVIFLALAIPSFAAGGAEKEGKRVAVFVPGVVSGSPVYEMLTAGARRAVEEAASRGVPASIRVVEAGTRQAEWGQLLTSLVASGEYDLIVSSNPALPDIVKPISAQFPSQRFLILDAYLEGNPSVTTYRYNQREQAYISGYLAALVSSSRMPHANRERKIGLVAGQEYPAMNGIILPAYIEGARAVDPSFEVDFRVVGNWYDAAKGAEIARAMKAAGVDVIMPIAGGANQGVIAAARELGIYVAWFDDNGYSKAPGYVISSSVMAQERLAYEAVKAFLDGKLSGGIAHTVGISDGYVDFVSDDASYRSTVPAELRARQDELMRRLRTGELKLPPR